MPEPLLIARNPDPDSSLPFIVRIPLGAGIVLRTRETWPRTAKVYCHRHDAAWPDDPDIVETIELRSISRRGPAIDIEADRTREARSQFVLTRARGREMIFWQTARVAKAARPNVDLPTARAGGLEHLEIVVDTRERYAWKFTHQQATTTKRALPVGDYASFVDDMLVAVVERKSLEDLANSLTSGRLAYRLADLAGMPRASVVVEDRYSSIFKLGHVRPALVADMLGECQVRWPSVPIVFAENRKLAQEWTFRFLGAAVREHLMGEEAHRLLPED
ncbi:ERCC4 domain-containing protein [Nostocoides australiense]|uniref:ERCC4 domain-containing protein n=1 Tax=Nostocoides australiense TaxID=99480 RepID=UPI0006614DC7|nr:ERCC4 domain-containing protein [Tetrasphaera australiensis]MCA0291058.1 ERCC4 domain-containing protein [Actinomycetota bacterium]HPF82139.1 ERCC4 domain-containing protein [Tetrasphaera australiensis]